MEQGPPDLLYLVQLVSTASTMRFTWNTTPVIGKRKTITDVQVVPTASKMRFTWNTTPVIGKRKAITDVPTCMNGRPAKRHEDIDDSLIEGFAKLLSRRCLDQLPQEILLDVCKHFAEPWVLADELADWEVYTLDRESRIRQQTLIALTKTCRRLNEPATSVLYRCAHLRNHNSVFYFLSSLEMQPRLTELVKQVACPQEVLMSVAYAFFRSAGAENELATQLVHRLSPPIGTSRPAGRPFQWHYSYSRVALHSSLLGLILERVPGIRALSLTCHDPWHRSYAIDPLPLEHLSKLSIATYHQPEINLRDPNDHQTVLAWLNKSTLGRYPALKRLELVHPRGRWIARLVTVESTADSGSKGVEKYVESLTTLTRVGGAFAEWDLLSLQQDVFSPTHFHTLDYAGQSKRCSGACAKTPASGWNINRFLATAGRRVRNLNLDWEHEHPQLGQLGPTGTLTSLTMLTKLTHLTVSMQVLFQQQSVFRNQLKTMLSDPEPEFARFLPPSLRVLRISEFMLDVLRPSNPDAEVRSVTRYNSLLYSFMEALRVWWLDLRGDRELWFRHCLSLERHPRLADERARCAMRPLIARQRHQDVGREFAPVPRMPRDFAAVMRQLGAP